VIGVPVRDDVELGKATVLQESLVETADAGDSNTRWIWLTQLIESQPEPGRSVLLRAHARKLARRVDVRGSEALWFLERDSRFDPGHNAIELSIDPRSRDKAKLAPRHDVMLYPRGVGLGRVLMSMLIRRAKERFPDRAIARATVGPQDARTNEERDRRNDFYEGHGFKCDFSGDPERRVGHVYVERIDDLFERINASKVTLLSPATLVTQYVEEHNDRKKAGNEVKSLRASLKGTRECMFYRLGKERRVWIVVATALLLWALVEHFRFW
jgi:GNAT superfamily N-acetyltransferase